MMVATSPTLWKNCVNSAAFVEREQECNTLPIQLPNGRISGFVGVVGARQNNGRRWIIRMPSAATFTAISTTEVLLTQKAAATQAQLDDIRLILQIRVGGSRSARSKPLLCLPGPPRHPAEIGIHREAINKSGISVKSLRAPEWRWDFVRQSLADAVHLIVMA
jgi:hypothetical protein